MSSLFSKALVYLGLVDEEDVEPDVEGQAPASSSPSSPRARAPRAAAPVTPTPYVEGRRVEPPASATRTTALRSGGGPSTVRPIRSTEAQSDILVVEEFTDARVLADRVRERVPVVLDLRIAGPDLVRRVIDFSSGLIYALDGTMKKVGEGLVLVLPPHVTISAAERRRLAGLGGYELPIDD